MDTNMMKDFGCLEFCSLDIGLVAWVSLVLMKISHSPIHFRLLQREKGKIRGSERQKKWIKACHCQYLVGGSYPCLAQSWHISIFEADKHPRKTFLYKVRVSDGCQDESPTQSPGLPFLYAPVSGNLRNSPNNQPLQRQGQEAVPACQKSSRPMIQ